MKGKGGGLFASKDNAAETAKRDAVRKVSRWLEELLPVEEQDPEMHFPKSSTVSSGANGDADSPNHSTREAAFSRPEPQAEADVVADDA